MLFILKIDEYSYLKMSYSRRRIYQYNEDFHLFQFLTAKSFFAML